jgi:hypothetical protein
MMDKITAKAVECIDNQPSEKVFSHKGVFRTQYYANKLCDLIKQGLHEKLQYPYMRNDPGIRRFAPCWNKRNRAQWELTSGHLKYLYRKVLGF